MRVEVRKEIHARRRETPSRCERPFVALVIERPLGLSQKQRKREGASQCQRESARTGLQRRRVLRTLDKPEPRSFERLLHACRNSDEIGMPHTLHDVARLAFEQLHPRAPSIARSVSSESTFVVPSQIDRTSASRRSIVNPVSST